VGSYFDLWAKTDKKDEARWHALPFHLVDVGVCAEVLWDYLPALSKQIALKAFGSDAGARKWLAFFAAIHDVGKANRYFQAKNIEQKKRLTGYELMEGKEPALHGNESAYFLFKWFKSIGWSKVQATTMSQLIGAHHGSFFSSPKTSGCGVGNEPWNSLGKDLLGDLATFFLGDEKPDCPFTENPSPALTIWMTGFISVADWLGSNEAMTSWRTEPSDFEEYAGHARVRAYEVLNSLQFKKTKSTTERGLTDLVPSGRSPNEMQKLADRIASAGFSLAIVEGPTGEGKTESAFRLAESSRARGEGLYFALPTQATANGIYERVSQFLQVSGTEHFNRLVHSNSWLVLDDLGLSDFAFDWFAGKGRSHVAPYGTGTIDQILTAALTVRHYFVRLWALAGKVIIVDEVHAYDVYMQSILGTLLGWLREMGCKVILLSATLPQPQQHFLLQSWEQAIHLCETTYPCITWIDDEGVAKSESFEVSERKPLTIHYAPYEDEEPVISGCKMVQRLLRENNRTIALMFNTVRSAQQAYETLKAALGEAVDICIFHARFTVQDRQEREKEVLAKFGKTAPRDEQRVLVATQVIEQSLDLDFDAMITELAPIDLLIQRAGRLHRHSRDSEGNLNPPGTQDARKMPALLVLRPGKLPEEAISLSSKVYDYVVQYATHEYIENGVTISEPLHVSQAVNEVYAKTAFYENALGNLEETQIPMHQALQGALKKRKEKIDQHKKLAEIASIQSVDVAETEVIVTRGTYLSDDENDQTSDNNAKTRISEFEYMSIVVSRDQSLLVEKPMLKQKKEISLRTVKIPYVRDHGLETPSSWKSTRALSGCFHLPVENNEHFATSKYKYVYTPEVGLVRSKL
jgi:CRISPR-associated endonuclease/helicase Cas3